MNITEMIDKMNAYQGDDIYQDLIYPAATADEIEFMEKLLPASSDGTTYLVCGLLVRYDQQRKMWYVMD